MPITIPEPSKQAFMHNKLVEARSTVLHGALRDALARADPDKVSAEISKYAPADARVILAAAGIRDERVFATPEVIRTKPTLVGYYRLLTGISQKGFYKTQYGTQPFFVCEQSGNLTPTAETALPAFCEAINQVLGQLVQGIGRVFAEDDVQQLPILTLGAQFDGSHRNTIGQKATLAVFESIKAVVEESGIAYAAVGGVTLTFINSAGRQISVKLASDPDVVVQEETGGGNSILKVAIEIKGGTDKANVYNRAGEAEKSHQKVRGVAKDFWTCISLVGTDGKTLHSQAPTTTQWFDVTEVTERTGQSWKNFRSELSVALGIPITP